MNISDSSPIDRPAFQSLDVEELPQPPSSKLAIAAFLLGLFSLLAILTQTLLLLSVVATCVGVVAVWMLSRSTESRGLWLAQSGLAMGVISGAWVIAADNSNDDYLFEEAAEHARAFLTILSEDRIYEALELTKIEPDRQIAGTDLQQYYQSLNDEDFVSARDEFLENPSVVAAREAGPAANWQFSRGVEVGGNSRIREVEVEMVNAADPGRLAIGVQLRRVTGILRDTSGPPAAHWYVYDLVPR